jgi:hypothetical protein
VKLGAFDTNIHSMLFWTSLYCCCCCYCHHRKLERKSWSRKSVKLRAACDKSLAHKTLLVRARWIDFHIGTVNGVGAGADTACITSAIGMMMMMMI